MFCHGQILFESFESHFSSTFRALWALLSVQVSHIVQAEIRLPISKVVFWSDSTSILCYIKNESRRFHTFVANPVAKIQSATKASQWRYVKPMLTVIELREAERDHWSRSDRKFSWYYSISGEVRWQSS